MTDHERSTMRTKEELLLKIDSWYGSKIASSRDLKSKKFIISWDEISMFGFGDTEEEAIKDLLGYIIEYFDILKEKENDSMGTACLRDKEILNKFFNY